MKSIITTTTIAFALCVTSALAQQQGRIGMGPDQARMGVNISAVGHFPVGDFQEIAGFGIGGMGGIEVGTRPGLALTARSGYIRHMEEDDFTVSHVPIFAGAKISPPNVPFYVVGELGPVMTWVDYDGINIFIDNESETNFGWNAGVGSLVGPVDLRFTFNVWDNSNLSDTMTLGVSLGFTVWSL